jgi:hypothetical protein
MPRTTVATLVDIYDTKSVAKRTDLWAPHLARAQKAVPENYRRTRAHVLEMDSNTVPLDRGHVFSVFST